MTLHYIPCFYDVCGWSAMYTNCSVDKHPDLDLDCRECPCYGCDRRTCRDNTDKDV